MNAIKSVVTVNTGICVTSAHPTNRMENVGRQVAAMFSVSRHRLPPRREQGTLVVLQQYSTRYSRTAYHRVNVVSRRVLRLHVQVGNCIIIWR